MQPAEPDDDRPVPAAAKPADLRRPLPSRGRHRSASRPAQASDETGLRGCAGRRERQRGPDQPAEAEHIQAVEGPEERVVPAGEEPGQRPAAPEDVRPPRPADITDRDERLAYVSDIANRPVGSTNDLTDDEVAG
ncbi:hypothetical protein [Micromonospora pallida]|uniref:hypothetical protein n=1 Tax=Micromonospora pallida TaxID=145854 RepID=UPI001FE092C8|nr:hypothetical protein [Micromonospora pallida]